ncbi:MAG: insulinase family protein [Flavipsychrobacter sp.]|nr:insulinase family protein [Flavipsychrobacter sp.]
MNWIKSAFLVAGIALSISGYAQGKHEWKEATSAGYKYKYVTNDPFQARFYTLKNGLTVILSPISKDPRMQVYIATKAGSKTDPADHTGLAHYLEHMLFKGTSKYGSLDWGKEKPYLDMIERLYEEYNEAPGSRRPALYHVIDSVSGLASKYAIANEYDKMMSSMGAQGTNAFTSYEQTVYTEDIPSNAADKFLKVQVERFTNPVFRIFHTELEAVYEEKNRTLDNDGRKANELMMANLFLNHNYGKQTTIGTIEHLKSPSLVAIRKYFDTYYVPNNMGVIVSGDFNPDELIKKIDAEFSVMKSKPVPEYKFQPEAPLTAPVIKEVVGPDAEFVSIAYRLPGVHSKDAVLADLVGQILSNGKAGLIDLNLVKKQKLLRAVAGASVLVDHGFMYLQGSPTQGQTLDEVKSLILNEVENLKKGNFDDALQLSIVNNMKKYMMQQTESYGARASILMSAFTGEEDWLTDVEYIDRMSGYTKKDIMDFANKYFGNNYVAVYKRKGEDKNVLKVDKPPITPVETNAGKESPFLKMINDMPVSDMKPVWVDYDKDLKRGKVGAAEVLYVHNPTNGLFRMTYRYKAGNWNDRKMGVAAQYLQFLGTDKMSAEDISKEFYKLACSFTVNASDEYTNVTIEGLQENFDQAVSLFETLVKNCKADEKALDALKGRLAKARSDAKNNKGAIMQGLISYARYGSKNPFNNVLSNEEMKSLTGEELVKILHNLSSYEHRILYYGPQELNALTASLSKAHTVPGTFTPAPAMQNFAFSNQAKTEVLFANYDMVQSEIRWVRNVPGYDPTRQATIDVFNNYFGGGMGTIVFQTIRESKALAYSTSAYVVTPQKKEDPYYISAYVGCQADKFNESIAAMNELLTGLPEVENNIINARAGIKKDIETERITEDGIIYNYLAAERKNLKTDIRKIIYESADKLDYRTLNTFHKENMSGKPYTYCVVASDKKVNVSDMEKLGALKKLSLEEIFGY